MKRDYLTLIDILELHKILIDRYGGSHGLRDGGALEAAIYRPQSGYYTDIFQEAAALWESLVINHPFIDGNKRIGFAAMEVFLRINGYKILHSEEIYGWIIGSLSDHSFTFANINNFLRQWVVEEA